MVEEEELSVSAAYGNGLDDITQRVRSIVARSVDKLREETFVLKTIPLNISLQNRGK